MRSPFKDISKKKDRLKKAEKDASSGYALRSHSPNVLSLKPSSSSTDTNFITTSTQSSPVPTSQICLSCQSADTKRNSNLVEVVKDLPVN